MTFLAPPHIQPLPSISLRAFSQLLDEEAREWETRLEWDFGPCRDIFFYLFTTALLQGFSLMSGLSCEGYGVHVAAEERRLLLLYFSPAARAADGPAQLLSRLLEDPTVDLSPAVEGQMLFPPEPSAAVEETLRARGFAVVERVFMRAAPVVPPAAPPLPPGIRLLPFDLAHENALARALAASYVGHPDRDVSALYLSAEGCGKLLQQLVLTAGCGSVQPECSWTAWAGDDVAGMALVTRISPASSFIPQIAVAPGFQSLGIGKALLARAMESVRHNRPDDHIGLSVTVANQKARDWYERAGFATVQRVLSFSRHRSFPPSAKAR